jgi:4-amino-4-deoxy-L-arabinose transferase-like glycosyltransferase
MDNQSPSYTLSKLFIMIIACCYAIACIASICLTTPAFDTLYYWEWGRHVGLSYLDGPPMVAYLFHLYQLIFPATPTGINTLSVISNLIVTIPIYLLAKAMFGKQRAMIAALIWLVTFFTFQKYAMGFSYDTPLTFFWGLSCYWFYLAYQTKQAHYFYLFALSAGCMMLSKYTGILLFLSLGLMCLFSKSYRPLLKNIHVYASLLLVIVIFSPVIIWNMQNHYASFAFQGNHGFAHPASWKTAGNYLAALFGNYNVFIIAYIVFLFSQIKKILNNDKLTFLFYTSIVTLLFFLYVSIHSTKYNWPESFYVTAVIMIAYYLSETAKKITLLKVLLIISTLAIVGLAFGPLFKRHHVPDRVVHVHTYQQFNHMAPLHNPIVVYNYGDGAGLAFYLHTHPRPVAFPGYGNQYGFWGKSLLKQLKQHQVQIITIVTSDEYPQHLPVPMHCHKTQGTSPATPRYPLHLNVFQCRL